MDAQVDQSLCWVLRSFCWFVMLMNMFTIFSGNPMRPSCWNAILIQVSFSMKWFEPPHDKTNKMACAPNEASNQPGHLPSLIWIFAVHMKKHWTFSYLLSAQQRLWSDWADAQADLSLRWVHSHFVGIVMRWLIYVRLQESLMFVRCREAILFHQGEKELLLQFITELILELGISLDRGILFK